MKLRFLWMTLGLVAMWGSIAQAQTWPNEPPGSTLITENPFNAGFWPCNACEDAFGWVDQNNNAVIVSNPLGLTPPVSPPNTVRRRLNQGQAPDTGPGPVWTGLPGLTEMYWGMYMMLSPNWTNSNGGFKLFSNYQANTCCPPFPTINPIGGGEMGMTYYLPGDNTNCDLPGASGASCPSAGPVNIFPTPEVPISVGQWHRIEHYIKRPSSATAEDGIIKVWVDGTLAINLTAVDGDPEDFIEAQIANVYQGSPNETFDIYYDHIRLVDTSTASADTFPPVRSAGAPSGALSAGTTSTEIRLTATDSTSPVTCRHSNQGVSGQSYASMPNTMSASGCSGGSSHCATIGGLTNGNSYTFNVRCQDNVTPTPNANPDDFTISFSVASGATPATPANLAITSTTTMTVGVSWDSVTGATGYRLLECHTGGTCTPATQIADQAGTTFTHIKLVPFTTYRYAVKSYNTNGESALSSAVQTTTTQIGIAASYPQDAGIGGDGRIVWYEPFHGYANIAALVARYDDSRTTSAMTFNADIPLNAPLGSQSIQFIAQDGVSTPLLYQEFPSTSYDQLFMRYYVKFQAGANYGHSSIWLQGYDPLPGFPNPQAGVCNVNGRFVGAFENSADTIWDAYLYWPTMHEDGNSQCFGNELFNDGRAATAGVWHSLEIMVKLNSAPYNTTNDGEIAFWLNGTKIGHYGQGFPGGTWSGGNFTPFTGGGGGGAFEGFRWRVSAAPTINNIWIQHFDNGPNFPSPSPLLYDQLVVATEYIGPLQATAGDQLSPAIPANLRVVQP